MMPALRKGRLFSLKNLSADNQGATAAEMMNTVLQNRFI
jgi:hypothetical protein